MSDHDVWINPATAMRKLTVGSTLEMSFPREDEPALRDRRPIEVYNEALSKLMVLEPVRYDIRGDGRAYATMKVVRFAEGDRGGEA